MSNDKILKGVENYYTSKIKEHGASPKGVDWNSEESQNLRFEQLLNIIPDASAKFSLLDYGCGFGSMYKFMKEKYPALSYTGFDISEEMIVQAKKLFPETNWTESKLAAKYDYVVASGIFNVRLENKESDWEKYLLDTLIKMNEVSSKGFSFNVLTKYSDKEYMRDYLHYADPMKLFDYCKKNFSPYVAVLHDYPLYEFSILVRK